LITLQCCKNIYKTQEQPPPPPPPPHSINFFLKIYSLLAIHLIAL
jgi:hypothetical protein